MTTAEKLKLRESAAVVLVRGRGDALEVFWVKRSDRVTFMPGFHAFVGGTVVPADAELDLPGDLDEAERILKACAIREAFEEAGVLVGLDGGAAATGIDEARRRLLAGEASFAGLARERGWRFDAGALAFAGRWTTPPFGATRFDASYYLVRLDTGETPAVHEGELASGEWIRPSAAIERWRRGVATFAAPILHTLEEIGRGEHDLAARLAAAPERSAQPIRRIELKWGIVLQPMKTKPLPPATHTNAYLVGGSDMALIDPGSDDPAELESLFRLIEALAADRRRLKIVLLTHHHADHAAGAAAVSARYSVPIAAHPETAKHVRVDRLLQDGEAVSLMPSAEGDWPLWALHTPGHARGHLCFLHERTKSLFSGDHITGGTGTVIIDPPDGDMAAYVQSLARLEHERVETLFPGHGSPQGAALARIRSLIAHRREREAKVLAALEAAPLDLATLVERAYADTARDLWRYAERSLLAHLIELEWRGRAARDGDRWRAVERK